MRWRASASRSRTARSASPARADPWEYPAGHARCGREPVSVRLRGRSARLRMSGEQDRGLPAAPVGTPPGPNRHSLDHPAVDEARAPRGGAGGAVGGDPPARRGRSHPPARPLCGPSASPAMLGCRGPRRATRGSELPARDLLARAVEMFELSGRGFDRALKVARTIADLDASERVSAEHLSEALGYRGPGDGGLARAG